MNDLMTYIPIKTSLVTSLDESGF